MNMDATVEQLRYFLATAPNDWDPEQTIKRFLLPTGEYISCVLWRDLFHITGTDIVRVLTFRFQAAGRPVRNVKKFEEGVFSDLRNLKPGVDATLEEPRSEFLELLYKHNCVRTQKKQKVFYWFSVPHDRLFQDALDRDLKREALNIEPCTVPISQADRSLTALPSSLYSIPHNPTPAFPSYSFAPGMSLPGTPQQHHQQLYNPSMASAQIHPAPMQPYDLGMHHGDANSVSNGYGQLILHNSAPTMMDPAVSAPLNTWEVQAPASVAMTTAMNSQAYMDAIDSTAMTADASEMAMTHISAPFAYAGIQGTATPADPFPRVGKLAPVPSAGNPTASVAFDQAYLDLMTATAASVATAFQAPVVAAANPQPNVHDLAILAAGNGVAPTPMSMTGSFPGANRRLPMTSNLIDTQDGPFVHLSGPRHGRSVSMSSMISSNSGMRGRRTSASPSISSEPYLGVCGDAGVSKHNSQRRFDCTEPGCGKSFKRHEHLKRHQRTHTGERPYVCAVNGCNKGFARSDNLAMHLRVHGIKPGTPTATAIIAAATAAELDASSNISNNNNNSNNDNTNNSNDSSNSGSDNNTELRTDEAQLQAPTFSTAANFDSTGFFSDIAELATATVAQ